MIDGQTLGEPGYRAIRTFHSRRGRVRPSASQALENYWADFSVDLNEDETLSECLGTDSPIALEIGCGLGEAALDYARQRPELTVVAIDVHRQGLGVLIRDARKAAVTNLRVSNMDAVQLLANHTRESSLDVVRIFFPDPWPKQRHRKRRLIQPDFVELVVSRLTLGGELRLATDWQDYAVQMLDVVLASTSLEVVGGGFCDTRPADRTVTRFEAKGLAQGHQIFDIQAFRRDKRLECLA